ncbi:MAG: nucleotidyltransferase domain-containing protein [Candidatus Obscuribacter sp.]|nr:nucleotidyltransferase domain-containing protein [Candidatus Obscuribacter sp.]MBK9281343.1 nucleotidyltransferase domain-containing protein [Candidatus Obscuribacter sp.]
MSILLKMTEAGHISAPAYLLNSARYEVLMGSHAFGTASVTSDFDVYGFFIGAEQEPQSPILEEFRLLKLESNVAPDGRTDQVHSYDIVLFGLPLFLKRCLEGKSQSLETLFVAEGNILEMAGATGKLRDNRHLFLHKRAAQEFLNFARRQLEGMERRSLFEERRETIERWGFDIKAAYHSVRLYKEVIQLLSEGTLDLRRNCQLLLDIRQGQWSEARVIEYCAELEAAIASMWSGANLPETPDKEALSRLMESLSVSEADVSKVQNS